MSISEIEKDFAENGYLIIEEEKGREIVETIEKSLLPIVDTVVERAGFSIPENWKELTLSEKIDYVVNNETDNAVSKLIYQIMPTAPGLISILNHPVLLEAAKSTGQKLPVCATVPVTRLDRPQDKVYPTPSHQDFWYSMLCDNALVVWVAMAPLTEEMGYLEMIPKSHKRGLAPFKPTGMHEPYMVAEDIAEEDWVKIPIKKGQILVFNSYLIHRSGMNVTKDRTRFSIQFRYNDLTTQKELTSSYTPVHSTYVQRRQQELLAEWGYSESEKKVA